LSALLSAAAAGEVTIWAGIVIIIVVAIRTLPDLIRAIRYKRPSDDD
jgi:hypothetical protein